MYRIHLNQFDGPLDLLLFFIRRDELDVYDIPIAQIADEFLDYVRVMEQVDLDGVGDFVYMAALLINIKARMLLPSPEVDEDGEPIDPRKELVERLLEYMRFKEASESLTDRAADRADRFTRGEASAPDDELAERREELVDCSVFDLVSALRRVLTEAPETPVHAVEAESYSVEEQRGYVLGRVVRGTRMTFSTLVHQRTKVFVIATFLAVLELVRQGALQVSLTERLDDFSLERPTEEEEEEAVPATE